VLLPDEVWWLSLSYVTPESVLICGYIVCKTWQRSIRANTLTYTSGHWPRINDSLLERMPMITTLRVMSYGFQCTAKGLAMLSALRVLKLPDLRRSPHLSEDLLLSLPRYTKLSSLFLSGNYRMPLYTEMPNLLAFEAVHNTFLTDSVIASFTALQSLSLFKCHITDKVVGMLTGLTSLTLTYPLNSSFVSNNSLINLTLLTHLEIIGLEGSVNVSPLTGLRSLKRDDLVEDEELLLLSELRVLDLPYYYLYMTNTLLTSLAHLSSLTVYGLALDRSIARQDLTRLTHLEFDNQCYNTKNANNFCLEEFYAYDD